MYTYYGSPATLKIQKFNINNFPAKILCINERCQQGGLELKNIILFYESGDHSFSCNGHEGTPKGKYKGDPCENTFRVKLSIERRNHNEPQ